MSTYVSIQVGESGWAATFRDADKPAYIIHQTAFEAKRAAERELDSPPERV